MKYKINNSIVFQIESSLKFQRIFTTMSCRDSTSITAF